MAFALDNLVLVNKIGSDDFAFPFQGKYAKYELVKTLVGVDLAAEEDGPFVPYRVEEIIQGDQAVTLSLTVSLGSVKKNTTILCAMSKLVTAVSSVKSGTSYPATSLFGKKIKYGKVKPNGTYDEWDILSASLINNVRNHD